MSAEEEPVLRFADARAFGDWLAEHHADASGVVIEFAKRATGVASVTHDEALLQALRYGWIDARVGSGPEGWFRQRFTPRRPRGRWSRRNREFAEQLIAREEMEPAGLREVEAARADGRWDAAYAGPRTATVPTDLQRALDADPEAARVFAGLTSQNRYAILYRLEEAKRPETRARRLERFVGMLRSGETLH